MTLLPLVSHFLLWFSMILDLMQLPVLLQLLSRGDPIPEETVSHSQLLLPLDIAIPVQHNPIYTIPILNFPTLSEISQDFSFLLVLPTGSQKEVIPLSQMDSTLMSAVHLLLHSKGKATLAKDVSL